VAKFYVTYGCGSHQAGCYAVVEGEDYAKARKKVFDVIGPKFSMMYDEDGFSGQVEKYNLREIPLMPMTHIDGD